MTAKPLDEKAIFKAAFNISSGAGRRDFLEDACQGDLALLERIQHLLRQNSEHPDFLESPAVALDSEETRANRSDDLRVQQIGPYRIREKIGEGGMGVVYVAEQTEPVRRKVALKIIKPGMDTREVIARFEAERQALAFMEHPNIARVLDAGATESGRSYFVMELVRGIPITKYCDEVKATPSERLELFKTVCDAVQHAHQKGIIHRDIKPSNVLVTQVGAKPVVKVIDFGLAKATSGQRLTEKTVYTGFMRLVGTPVYMSPEQAGLSNLDVDTRSDIYSLGVLLYELLTGKTPLDRTEVREKAYDELCRTIREVEAVKPSARVSTMNEAERSAVATQRKLEPNGLRQLLHGDLDRVVLKAIEKDRDQRYETPKDFAADIDRFLNDQPVLAVPPSHLYLARKYFRRHRAAILTTAGLFLFAVSAAVISTWLAVRATRAEAVASRERIAAVESERAADEARQTAEQSEQAAVAARKQAEDSADQAVIAKKQAEESARQALAEKNIAERMTDRERRIRYAANIRAAAQLWDSPNGDLSKIEELLTTWMPTTDSQTDDWRDFAWRYQWTQLHKSAAVAVLDSTGATISADGHLLTANETGLRKWDQTGKQSSLQWNREAGEVIFSPNRRSVVIFIDGLGNLVDVATGRTKLDIPHRHCTFSARGEFLAAWDAGEKTARVWKLTGEEPEPTEPLVVTGDAVAPGDSTRLQLSDDGRSFLIRGYPIYPCISVFLPEEKQPITWWHRNGASSCAWSPNGKIMASGSHTGMLHLRLRNNPLKKLVISTHGKNLDVLRFSPDGTRLAVGGSDGTFDLWDTSALLKVSESSQSYATSPGESGANADDPETSLPASARPVLVGTTKAHLSGGIKSLIFSADGTKLATFARGVSKLWSLDGTAGRYEVADFGEALYEAHLGFDIEDSERGVRVQRIHLRHHDVVSGELRVGDIIVGASDVRYGELTDFARRRDLGPVYSGPYGSTVQFTVEGEDGDRRDVVLRRIAKSDPRPIRVCFSPDGMTVAVAGQRTGTTSINLATGQSRRYPQSGSNSVAISPDGQFLAMDGWQDVLIWDLRKDQEHARLDGRVSVDPVPMNAGGGSVAFSPDGKYLAMGTGYPYNSAPKRSDLKVWRVSDLKEVRAPLFKNDRVLSDIKFTPDSAYLVATDHAGIVRLWDTKTWKLQDRQFVVGSGSAALAISKDGKTLATGGSGQTVLWDFATGKKLRVLSGATPWSLDFSRDGKTLVSSSRNHNVILWDVATGMQLRTFHAHTDAVKGVAFSPDGNTLATSGSEGVLRIWKAAELEEIDAYPGTLESQFRLGELRNREDRFAEAEAILTRLLQTQQQQRPVPESEIDRTKTEISKSLLGQGKMPRIIRQPKPMEASWGDEVTLGAELSEGTWDVQWFRNGQPVHGANSPELTVKFERESDLGAYHFEVSPVGRNDVDPVHSDFAYLVEAGTNQNRGVRWEAYRDIPGKFIESLTGSPKFPDEPDETEFLENFEIRSNTGDDYGGRLTGYLIPPVTGEYVFYLCSDDQSQLFLSETESPDGAEMIAFTRWTKRRAWLSELSPGKQGRSKPIFLQRGRRYFVRALFKEGKPGEDYLGVAWQMPGQRPPRTGDPPIPGLFLSHNQE